jgi:GxxExxY protein
MIDELIRYDFNVKSEVWVPIKYKEKTLESSLKLDLLVNDLIIVELKATETIIPVYKAQLLSYLRLANKPKGLLINFHCDNITKQLVPLVTKEFAELPKY